MSKTKINKAKKSSNTKINKKNKNDSNIKFLIPIILGIFVLIAAVFAKNITVKRTMSITETKTIECTSENYNIRTSDSVCGAGYKYLEDSCVETPNGGNSCPNGGTLNTTTNKCEYAATVDSYNCVANPTSQGKCSCSVIYENPGDLGASDTRYTNCNHYTTCEDACQALVGTFGITSSIPSVLNTSTACTSGSTSCSGGTSSLTCPNGGCAGNDLKCHLYQEQSCPTAEGYTVQTTNYSCPNGGELDQSTGICSYDPSQSQNTMTYSGEITCERLDDTYTVRYNKNNENATGTTADSIHTIGVAKTLTPNGYVLGGHIFNGWNSKADGTGTNYTDEQSVTNLSTTNGVVVDLYAKWTACPAGQYAEAGAAECSPCLGNTYTNDQGQSACLTCPEGQVANSTHTGCVVGTYEVEYKKNHEIVTGTMSNSIHTIGVAKTLTPNAYKLGGYIFGGWNSKADGTGTNYTDEQSVINLSTTNGAVVPIYAKWTACPAGQYAEAGATKCSPCVDEAYTEEPGQAACLACPEGQVANSTHTGCEDGTSEKVSCPAGTYLKANGKTEEDCEVCPEGYYCPGGDYIPDDEDQGKEPCPEGHIDGGVGLSKEESCKIKCENGYYKDDTAATSCVACPDGTTSLAHYVNFSRVSDDGTCFTKEYKCYVCGASIKTYTWTNKYMGNDQSCVVDANKNSSDKCKENIVNPKTGLFEVGGIIIGLLGIAAVGYYLLKSKKAISNI